MKTQPASNTSYTNALVRHYTEQARANAQQGAPAAKASGLTPYFGPAVTSRKSVFDPSQARHSQNLTPANGIVNYGVDRQRTFYVSDTRQNEIEVWLTQNINAKDNDWLFPDDIGDERVANAMTGDSPLGALTFAEKRYLIDAAVVRWREADNQTNIIKTANHLRDADAETLAAVAEVYAIPSANAARGGADEVDPAEAPEVMGLRSQEQEMLRIALEMDATAVLQAYQGVEGALGEKVADMKVDAFELLQAVAEAKVDPASEGVSQMITALFLKAYPGGVASPMYREQMAGALAQVMSARLVAESGAPVDMEALRARYEAILASDGGSDLLFRHKVMPELRVWALAEIATNPAWTEQALAKGWESEVVMAAYSEPVFSQYQGLGHEPMVLKGEALRNAIGLALGIEPDRLPPGTESASAAEARLAQGMSYRFYAANTRIDAIAARIEELGGKGAEVSILPVVVSSNEFGATKFNVFKVRGEDGKTYFIEDVDPGRHYTGFDDWKANSRLPPGQMMYLENLEWGPSGSAPKLETAATASVTDTFGEWVTTIGDKAALAAGIIAGAALIVGTGGTGAFVVAGAAGLYTSARAGEQLHDAHVHGVDVSDLSNPQVRALWLDAAAGVLSVGGMGAARLATAGNGVRGATVASGLIVSGNVADGAAIVNQAHHLSTHWSNLSNAERASGMLQIAFWGGMAGATTRASGARLADSVSFTRIHNALQHGSPHQQAGESWVATPTRGSTNESEGAPSSIRAGSEAPQDGPETRYTPKQLMVISVNGQSMPAPPNLEMKAGFSDLTDPALDPARFVNDLQGYLKKSSFHTDDGGNVSSLRQTSVAVASVSVDGQTRHFIAVSGKSWRQDRPGPIKLNGIEYEVVMADSNSVMPVFRGAESRTNSNHAEQKLMSHIQDQYRGLSARVEISVANSSVEKPGSCGGCAYTAPTFAYDNPDFDVVLHHGLFEGS